MLVSQRFLNLYSCVSVKKIIFIARYIFVNIHRVIDLINQVFR